jgi:hypothetical protein
MRAAAITGQLELTGFIAITGQFRAPRENAEDIAERIGRYLNSLADIDAQFCRWIRLGTRSRSVVPAAVTMPPDEAELRTWITEKRVFGSCAGHKQHTGYSIRAMTPETNRICADFWLSVDFSDSAWWWLLNRVGVTFFGEGDRSTGRNPQSAINFLRRALLDLATIWDCDWAAVAEGDFRWDVERPLDVPMPRYRSGWMVYLDRQLCTRIIDPQDITIEKFDDGAVLLTAVSDAVFNPLCNPVHRAAGLRLQAALERLNEAPS